MGPSGANPTARKTFIQIDRKNGTYYKRDSSKFVSLPGSFTELTVFAFFQTTCLRPSRPDSMQQSNKPNIVAGFGGFTFISAVNDFLHAPNTLTVLEETLLLLLLQN
ncbi:hypothetical protein WA026_022628 [Henosepilachna vigintioctopunctata]|uniref:Uncharacterized protein n=1 Tax=Henosepilachna vigintioctopunctata TaxID=420089 RepID=A0AAW1UCY3_9CUCU